MIEFKNVCKKYPNGTLALDDVSLKIEDGEFVFIVGESGAGKSTMLKTLFREEKISSGSLVVDGYDLKKTPNRKIPYYRRNLGIVFQDFRLFPNKTVFENVAFAMRAIGVPTRDINRRVPTILSIVNLQDKAKFFPRELSGGEQQRVALARALANNPKLLLCDEPTGALDYKTGKQILQLLQDACRIGGQTVVIITHNSAITAMADRVFTMRSGQIESMRINENPVPISEIEW